MLTTRFSRAVMLAVLLLAGAALAGCDEQLAVNPPPPPAELMPVRQLAAKLQMNITSANTTWVVMKDAGNTNTVMVYSGARDGQAYLNGRPVGPSGGYVCAYGTVYVPQTLEPQIKLAMGRQPGAPAKTDQFIHYPDSAYPRPLASAHGRVLIDPGHGGEDPGAHSGMRIGSDFVLEKRVNLAIGLAVARRLKAAGVTVLMTRDGDQFPSLEDRYNMSNREHVDLFVALHADSLPAKPSANGFAVWVAPSASAQSLAAAREVENSMAAAGFTDRGINHNRYQVLIHNARPAMLIEAGFLSNYNDARALSDPATQERYAAAIAAGIANYLRRR